MPNGQVKNHSSRDLWVVEDDTGSPIAHKLAPNRQSPEGTDADGFRAVDGTPVGGHPSWMKLVDLCTADVHDSGDELSYDALLCTGVDDHTFGDVQFDPSPGWGVPI
ncbi:MAG: hypothetical protein ACFB4J_11565 [Elainellaceae cyanobacterium]